MWNLAIPGPGLAPRVVGPERRGGAAENCREEGGLRWRWVIPARSLPSPAVGVRSRETEGLKFGLGRGTWAGKGVVDYWSSGAGLEMQPWGRSLSRLGSWGAVEGSGDQVRPESWSSKDWSEVWGP